MTGDNRQIDYTPLILERVNKLPLLFATLTRTDYIEHTDTYQFEFNYYLDRNPMRWTVFYQIPGHYDGATYTVALQDCIQFCIHFACFRHGIELSRTV